MEPASAEEGLAKLSALRALEREKQAQWAEAKVYEADPQPGVAKWMTTFPYPYMNGSLHLGHAFAFSKGEFFTRYQRMLGKNVLHPFGFHCTGMPIQAAADKLRVELQLYGTPPRFPEPTVVAVDEDKEVVMSDKRGGSQSKAELKTGGLKWQWDILKSMGIPEAEIPAFADPTHWLYYFPQLGMRDLQAFGACVDWRRSFITTDANPFYDSFVRWQFNTLKAKEMFSFGKRNAIWAPQQNQPCADHERSKGEGVQPQEYTLIKMRVLEVPQKLQAPIGTRTLFMVAGTMRPETMIGQTNYWVNPAAEYGVYEVDAHTAFVCSDHSARNMSFQDLAVDFGKPVCLARIHGRELIGVPVSSPTCTYERIYALPMETILMNKATGIVTSVPSDAPDDWQNLADLKNDAALRAKWGVRDEWIMPFEPVSILEVPDLGGLAAKTACAKHGVKDRTDKDALKAAKMEVYQLGFYLGVMKVGPHAGKTVEFAKPLMRKALYDAGQGAPYAEPAEEVVSRSNEVCVVALTNQWSISYGEPEWRAKVERHVKEHLETYGEECRLNLLNTLGWMGSWAISRTYGLGTKVPWDPSYIIESLSDSTIYMAYYAVAHWLHTDLYGKHLGPAGITPDRMSHAVWDFIFFGKDDSGALAGLDRSALEKMRDEFAYWYPWDLRVSGRDLIQNHLTMSLYNHAAIFPEHQWPKGIRASGFMQLNDAKMSKSTGNFLTMAQAVERFGADSTRLVLARAGDSMTDGNFKVEDADACTLQLFTLVEFARSVDFAALRSGELHFLDRAFDNHINGALSAANEHYASTMFRSAVEAGFITIVNSWKAYVLQVGDLGIELGIHADMTRKYLRSVAISLNPVCPHVAQELWTLCGEKGFAFNALWPANIPTDAQLIRMELYLDQVLKETRRLFKLASAKNEVKRMRIFIASAAPPWQQKAAELIGAALDADPSANFSALMKVANSDPDVQKGGKAVSKLLPALVNQLLKGERSFDEKAFLLPLKALLSKNVGVPCEIFVMGEPDAPETKVKSQPGKPGVDFSAP